MLALIEPSHDRPALGEVVELAERAQVPQEPSRLVRRLEAEERADQLVDVRRAPVFHLVGAEPPRS